MVSSVRCFGIFVCGMVAGSAGALSDNAAPRTLDLQPPEEDLGSIGAALESIIAAEESQWQQKNEEYNEMRQRLLDIGRQRVRETITKHLSQSLSGTPK